MANDGGSAFKKLRTALKIIFQFSKKKDDDEDDDVIKCDCNGDVMLIKR